MEIEEKPIKLLLHFDVNKTIMIKDSVKLDGSTERIVQNIIAICAWGLFNPSDKSWKLATAKLHHPLDEGEQPLLIKSEDGECALYGKPEIQECELLTQDDVELLSESRDKSTEEKEEKACLLTFTDYMLKLHPNILSTEIQDYDERKVKDFENRKCRGKLLSEFVRGDCKYAPELKLLFEELIDNLKIKDAVSPDHKLYKYLSDYYSIIPSFFKLYNYLISQKEINGRKFDFKIIFRTFGSDHQKVHEEFEEFLMGNHPLFKTDFITEDICKQKYSNCGNFLRSTSDPLDIILIMGLCPNSVLLSKIRDEIFATGNKEDDIIKLVIENFEANRYLDFNQDALRVIRGVSDIRKYLLSCEDHFSCIQDDHAAWHFKDMSVTYAKPFIIDLSADICEIMFDDHCYIGDDCIINVIDSLSSIPIDYKDHINKFTVKSNPILALKNQSYFISIVEELLKVQLQNQKLTSESLP